MREIKVRGLVIEQLVSGEKWITSDEEYHEVYLNYAERSAYINGHAVVWESVSQYTGLKDKNGKEIYEGDVDSDDYNNLSVICYIEKYGAYCAVPLELYLHEDYENEVVYEYGYDCYFHNVTPKKYLNIIGNIYENSQLLKGDEEQMEQVEHGTFEVTQLLAEAKETEENGN